MVNGLIPIMKVTLVNKEDVHRVTLIFKEIEDLLANSCEKCYSTYGLFLFGVKDSISKTFRLDDH
jgi:hypothetical protein